jgi:hypothetical protein
VNGSAGSQGIQGIPGVNGTNGIDGTDGVDGIDGIDGINGTEGVDGSDGAQGPAGANGSDGAQGEQGIPGVNGTTAGQYIRFISTVDGNLKTGPKYLPLGTDSGIAASDDEASWIIDRDLTITGFFWNADSNNLNEVAEIILVKGTTKGSLSETSLSANLQGTTTGSATGSVSFSQGDLAAIKYSSDGDGNKKIKDLSITLIGVYD